MPPISPEKEPVLLSWSSGKDSALALWKIREEGRYAVQALLTVLTREYGRVSMHGVRLELLEQQAAALGLPLETVWLPADADNRQYEEQMAAALDRHYRRGLRRVVFGDIFLADVRQYREEKLRAAGWEGLFPLWGTSSPVLMAKFLRDGFRAVITCVDGRQLDGGRAGSMLDASFLADLPAGVDPCGENGEFHTFVFDGPLFSRPVRFETGETVVREERFHFCDLRPVEKHGGGDPGPADF